MLSVSNMDLRNTCPKACLMTVSTLSFGDMNTTVGSSRSRWLARSTTSPSLGLLSPLPWQTEKQSKSVQALSPVLFIIAHNVSRHVALVQIHGKEFQLTPLPLRTVRPFVIEDITLTDEAEKEGFDIDDQMQVMKFLKNKVNPHLLDVCC